MSWIDLMETLYGKNLNKEDIGKYFGSPARFGGITEMEYTQGKARGSRVLEVRNGTGLNFSVLPDRGLDIAGTEYRGRPVAWLSKNGIVAPEYYENSMNGFLRTFSGGLLTTCGLTQAGASCVEGEDILGLHGRISHTPAESVSCEEYWEGGRLCCRIRGSVRETCLYGENIVLRREILCRSGGTEIEINDSVTNEGYEEVPFMLLYHINFGFPVVSEYSRYYTRADRGVPWPGDTANGNGKYWSMEEPQPGYVYECFLHEMPKEGSGVYSAIINEKLDFGVCIEYSSDELPCFTQWKVMGCQDYVAAFEPGNCIPEGRVEAGKNDRLKSLGPGENYNTDIRIRIIDGEEAVSGIKRKFKQ